MRILSVKISDEISKAVEENCARLSELEGKRVTPSEVMRRAIISYLGLKSEPPPAGWGGKRKGAGKPRKKDNPPV